MQNNNTSDQQSGRDLFEEFPPISKEKWEEVIRQDLGGADYRQKLRWNTGEDVELLPFYRRDDLKNLQHAGTIPASKHTKNDWVVRQAVYDTSATQANQTARKALDRGANGLQFKLRVHKSDGMLGGDLEGTAIQDQIGFEELLSDIQLQDVDLHFDASLAAPALLAMLKNETDKRELDSKQVKASFLYDPYVFTATTGQLPKPEEAFVDDFSQMLSFVQNTLPNVRCLGVDIRPYHNAGATIVQELAFALATGSEYLAKLTDRNFSVDKITEKMVFSWPIGSNYFLEIAKLRTFRLLWAQLVNAYNPSGEAAARAYLHGETSRWNKTIYDSHTNMLRSTTEGMAAALAGCDSITIHPFNHTFQKPDELGQRIARNTQLIFKEEAHLDKVIDPAAGSYYIEVVTDKIAEKAWQLFQEIENQGGMLKAITNRTVFSMISESAQERDRAIAQQDRIFIGTNQYPNADERMSDDLDSVFRSVSLLESEKDPDINKEALLDSLRTAFSDGAQLGDIVPSLFSLGKQLFRPIQPYRGPQAFEELRLATERHDKTPKVFLLPMGNRKMRKRRSTFAANFFGCAGYKIIDHIGFDTVDKAISEIQNSNPDIVVICSSDSEYKELVKPICRQLSALDPSPFIVVAGYPETEIEDYKEAGVEAFVHSKSNVLEALIEFQEKLGIISNR